MTPGGTPSPYSAPLWYGHCIKNSIAHYPEETRWTHYLEKT